MLLVIKLKYFLKLYKIIFLKKLTNHQINLNELQNIFYFLFNITLKLNQIELIFIL